MAFIFGDKVKETSLSVGTGPMTLGGATAGFQSFASGVGLGNECFYGILNTIDNSWEMGRGTVGVGTITRDTVFSSSNANNLVNFTVGDKLIYTTVPESFMSSVLDTTAHSLVDHTIPPLNLLDATAHAAVDHTAAPFNLLSAAAHQIVDHTAAPFNLLNLAAHQAVDHTAAPLNLLDETAHGLVDHTIGPLFLLDTTSHSVLNHSTIPGINPAQVTVPERTAGTETALRSFAPADISAMAAIFGGGGGGGLQVATFAPTTFSWSASNTAIDTNALGFTPLVAIAFATFRFSGTLAVGASTAISVGVATAGNSYSHGTGDENVTDGNDVRTTYASGAIAGLSALGGGTPYNSAWDLATINVNQFTAAGIILQPSAALTGNLTLIVLG